MADFLMGLVQRYASRKFLIVVGFGGVLIYNGLEGLGLDSADMALLAILALAFIILEGQADIEERKGS